MTAYRKLIPAALAAAIVSAVFLAAAPAAEESLKKSPANTPGHITLFQAAVLGVVEGLTEYLPVSSTGHLILASHAMDLSEYAGGGVRPFSSKITKAPALDAFEVVIQLGAILAVLSLYRKRVGQMARGLVGRDAGGRQLFVALMAAFVPAAAVAFLFHKPIQERLFNPVSVAIALVAGGVLMMAVEHFFWRRRKGMLRVTDVSTIRLWQAVAIGAAQCLALWPGTSRSMVTIIAALVVGLDMLAAAEFSFLLALPTLGAATAYEGMKNWGVLVEGVGIDGMLVGLVVSGVVAALAIAGLVRWLTRHGLVPFGIYRIALGGVVIWYFMR